MTPLLPPRIPSTPLLVLSERHPSGALSTNLDQSRDSTGGRSRPAQAFIGPGRGRGRLIPPIKLRQTASPVPTHLFLFPAWLVGVRGAGGPPCIP